MDGGQDGADEGNDPGKLHTGLAVSRSTLGPVQPGRLTMLMEMVASANGSPMMRPMLKDDDR